MCSKGRFALKLEADLPKVIYKEVNMNKLAREVDIANIKQQLKEAVYELDKEIARRHNCKWADELLECLERHERRLNNAA